MDASRSIKEAHLTNRTPWVFLLGLAAGVALLLAPYSGRRTRRLIRHRAEDARMHLAKAGRDFSDKGLEMYERVKEFADDTARQITRGVSATG